MEYRLETTNAVAIAVVAAIGKPRASTTSPGRIEEAAPGEHDPFGEPVLGLPGWWAGQDAAFYADASVFRPPKSA